MIFLPEPFVLLFILSMIEVFGRFPLCVCVCSTVYVGKACSKSVKELVRMPAAMSLSHVHVFFTVASAELHK